MPKNIDLKIITVLMGFAMITFVGCIDEVDPKGLVNSEQMIVVNSIISPQEEFMVVDVSLSEPVLGKKDPFAKLIIKDAIVSLSDGEVERELVYDEGVGYSLAQSASFSIISGKTYYLKVLANGKTVTAECTVPGKAIVSDAQLTEGADSYYKVRLRWMDIPSVDSYYRLGGEVISIEGPADGDTTEYQYVSPIEYSPNSLFTDSKLDGQLISATGESYNFQSGSRKFKSVRAQLVTGDENYYNYFKTLEDYYYLGDDPFSEPFQLKTNINGGLGIFAAYQISEQEIELD